MTSRIPLSLSVSRTLPMRSLHRPETRIRMLEKRINSILIFATQTLSPRTRRNRKRPEKSHKSPESVTEGGVSSTATQPGIAQASVYH